MNFEGVYSALVTPFQKGEVDFVSLRKLVDHQLQSGLNSFVVGGTTAESPTLTEKEVLSIFEFLRNEYGPKLRLIVGSGTNSTKESIRRTRAAKEWGAMAALVVVPYYNKPPQRGLIAHFNAVADESGLPVILYNVPSRTQVGLELESILELTKNNNIVGIKEASGNIEFAKKIRAEVPRSFCLLSGDDASFGDFMEAGGDGIISVASQLWPKLFLDVFQVYKSNSFTGMNLDSRAALKLFEESHHNIQELYFESNPIPIKSALKQESIILSDELRLPLVGLSSASSARIAKMLADQRRRMAK